MFRAFVFLILACLIPPSEARVSHGSAPPPAYEGLVSSRARYLTNTDTTNKQIMASYGLISTETLTSVRLAISNFIPNAPDQGLGAAATVSASIEYPPGTCTQVKLGGLSSFSIADIGIGFTDYTTVSIPANTAYNVRIYYTNPSGILFVPFQNSFFGEAAHYGVNGIADQTVTCGAITNTDTSHGVPPLAVLAMTINPSVIVDGDSIAFGTNDVEDGSQNINGFNGKKGIITRSLGSIPFLNLSLQGNIAQFWVARATARALMLPKGSAIIEQLGINDLNVNSRTPAQVEGDLQAIAALKRSGEKFYKTTITPESSSTDGWLTTGNQTPLQQANHATLNTDIRNGIAGFTGFYDLASVWEFTQGSGIWIPATSCSGVACTPDGVHGTQNGSYALVPSSAPGIAMGAQTWPYLFKRDLDPASNDNSPMWVDKAA